MFRLPVCPYCHTVYHYGEVKKIKNEKTCFCYHCKKKFKIKKAPGYFVLWSLFTIAAILINIAVLLIMPVFSIWPLIVISVLIEVLGILFIPYFVSYKKFDSKKDQKK